MTFCVHVVRNSTSRKCILKKRCMLPNYSALVNGSGSGCVEELIAMYVSCTMHVRCKQLESLAARTLEEEEVRFSWYKTQLANKRMCNV